MSLGRTDVGGVAARAAVQAHWDPVPGYLNVAAMGLPPREVVAAMAADLQAWRTGAVGPADYDGAVARARTAFARLVAVDPGRVAIGSQVSALVGAVAAGLPDGARVVVPVGEFTSVTFPFMVHGDRGIVVEHVPLDRLSEAVRPGVDVVAFSLVQSADGRVVDLEAVSAAARAAGTLVVADLTQAAGWLPVDAARLDVTVTGAYKWLCSPRGSAFMTIGADAARRLRPVNAGWYAGQVPWASVYGPDMELAADARRFDTSPAWPVWVGTAAAVELFAGLFVDAGPEVAGFVRGHGAALADLARSGLGRPPVGLPVLALPDAGGAAADALRRTGCQVASRAGGVRISFHLWNDEDDVDRVVEALRSVPGLGGRQAP